MRSRLFRLVLAVVFFAAFNPQSHAAVQNRIASAVGGSSSIPLRNTVPARALRAADLGAAPASRKLNTLTLFFNLTAAQQADLNQLLADQQNPSSPSYHQWLTPEQYGARFGLSSSDLAKVSSWLTGQGFTITSTARSSNFIAFSGTVAQAQQAFGTSIHTISINGEQYISNLTDPVLPSAIAGVVESITGLNDFKAKPRSRRIVTGPVDPAHPQYTFSSNGTVNHYIAPGDFYTIYDVNPLLTSGINGTGESIVVVGDSDIKLSDIASFRTASGLPANVPTLQLYGSDPGIVDGDDDEASIDIEWSGAIAPAAKIIYAYGTDPVNIALVQAISNKLAPIVSISFGLCESGWGQASLNSFNRMFQQASAQGMTLISASGDTGAADCDVNGLATEGLAVDFPGTSPFVISAGGTMFNEGSGSYWNSSNGTNAGSATGYIPELPWNETNLSQGLDAGGAGGGGVSAFFAKPAWQVGAGMGNTLVDSSRDVPDISLNAGAMHDGYLVCSSASNAGTAGSCANGFVSPSGTVNSFGGTSFVAPTFAGMLALLEQKLGTTSGLGFITPNLYGLANSSYYNNIFHDVTSGNNNVACVQGTSGCNSGGSFGYTARPGYDLASGLGTIDATNLINGWALAPPAGGGSTTGTLLSNTAVTVNGTLCGISNGSLSLAVAVTNASSTNGAAPTGSLQILVDNAPVGAPVPVVPNGPTSLTLNTSTLTSGAHNVSVVYSGDMTYAGSKGSLFASDGTLAKVDVVSSTKADFALTPCTATGSVASGSVASGIPFTITPFNGFVGSVTLSASADSPLAATVAFTAEPVAINGTSAASSSFVLTAYQSGANAVKAASNPPASGKAPWYAAGSGATLACVLLVMAPRRRKWTALLAAVISVAAFGAIGCSSSVTAGNGGGGGGTTPPPSVTDAAPGTYNITITAVGTSSTGATLVHSSVVTFTVN